MERAAESLSRPRPANSLSADSTATPPGSTSDPGRLAVELISDVVCPWCFIGLRRLVQAIAELHPESGDPRPALRWRPYFLNPDTPPQGEAYRPFLEQKFGGPQRVAQMLERLTQAGRSAGVEFDFEGISVRPNTLLAHRLIHFAQQQGDATDLVERLFRGHFQLGEHIGEAETLLRIAADCGLDSTHLQSYLASNADAETVRSQVEDARRMGITSVPYFIFNGRVGVSGAQTPDLLLQAIRRSIAA